MSLVEAPHVETLATIVGIRHYQVIFENGVVSTFAEEMAGYIGEVVGHGKFQNTILNKSSALTIIHFETFRAVE